MLSQLDVVKMVASIISSPSRYMCNFSVPHRCKLAYFSRDRQYKQL